MATELRRGLVRISSNYTRLLLTLVFGIISVPILLRALGTEGFGLISLIAGTTGLVLIIVETVRSSLTYEVGRAFHGDDDEDFRVVYASANAVSAIVACLTSLVFVGFYFAIPLFKISDELLAAARWMILLQMADNFFRVLTAAPNHFFVIAERFVASNFFFVLRRSAILIGAIVAISVYGGDHHEKAIVLFAIVQLVVMLIIQTASVLWAFAVDRRSIPRLGSVTRDGMKRVYSTAKWNAAAFGASTIQIQVDQLMMNLLFGLYGNAVFAIAQRLAAYVRMVVNGMSVGIDAVTVRLNASEDGALPISELLRHSTRLHAIALMPALCYLLFFSSEVFHVWIAKSVDDPERSIPATVLIATILLFGMGSRAMSDNWTAILFGAGHVRKYAPMIVVGAFLNPVVAMLFWVLLPGDWSIASPAAGFTVIMVLFHFIGIPIHVARCIEIRLRDVYSPMLRPTLLAALCLPVAFLFRAPVAEWGPIRLFLSMGAYSLVYIVLCGVFELHRSERQRFVSAIRRRLPQRA